jgi:hypothetical protein
MVSHAARPVRSSGFAAKTAASRASLAHLQHAAPSCTIEAVGMEPEVRSTDLGGAADGQLHAVDLESVVGGVGGLHYVGSPVTSLVLPPGLPPRPNDPSTSPSRLRKPPINRPCRYRPLWGTPSGSRPGGLHPATQWRLRTRAAPGQSCRDGDFRPARSDLGQHPPEYTKKVLWY